MTVEEMLRHAGAFTPAVIEEKARKIMRHYVWTWKKGNARNGWCTACGAELEHLERQKIKPPKRIEYRAFGYSQDDRGFYQAAMNRDYDGTPKHLKTGRCPACGETVRFRSMSMGRSQLEERYFMTVYRRSAVDRKHIVCVGYRIELEWWRLVTPGELPISVEPAEVCLFRWGQPSARMVNERRWSIIGGWDYTWERRKKCESGYTGWNGIFNKPDVYVFRDNASYRRALQGTPWARVAPRLEKSRAGEYIDRISLLDRIGRYPCIEYLLNMGQEKLAKDAVDGDITYHGGRGHYFAGTGGATLNLRGKTPTSVLKLTPDEWAEVKGRKLRLTLELLYVIQSRRRYNVRMGIPVCEKIAARRWGYEWIALNEHSRYRDAVDPARAVKYAIKKGVTLRDYLDYLEQCMDLRADMKDQQVIFPRDFHGMHQRFTRQMEIMREEVQRNRRFEEARREAKKKQSLDEQIRKNIRKLGAYRFEANGIVLEPFGSAEEIIMEGAAQSICIGMYVDRYAGGGTILCKLRRAAEPDKPWHAVEFAKDGRMVQCRGARNRTLDVDETEVLRFWEAWDAAHGTDTEVHLTIERTKKEAMTA